ncbi:MAG: DUF6569 family protein [Pirellulales bacterium]
MTFTLPQVRIEDSQVHGPLSVFPLFDGELVADVKTAVDYLLSDEAMEAGLLTIEEVSIQGSVPELLVTNKGDRKILFLEGEGLLGAKQDRISNTSILIGRGKTKIPVSCVEQGRWNYKSRQLSSGGRHAPSKIRGELKRSVNRSVKESGEHHSDQGKVWEGVQKLESSHRLCSPTFALSDTFEALEEPIAEAQEKIRYVDGATGVAVALGKKVVAIELFDKAETSRKVWDRLLSGFIADALSEQAEQDLAGKADVERVLAAAKDANWDQVDPVGEGEEYRTEVAKDHASALCFETELVHGSVIAV